MDSLETGTSIASASIESLIDSRNREIAVFLPFILGFYNTSANSPRGFQNFDRIILMNPVTQVMIVIERRNNSSDSNNVDLGWDSLLRDLFLSKGGQPPASKASIEALPSVEIEDGEKDGEGCAICLEEWENGARAKKMPCKHLFHGECIEKWLKMHGSCPVCRHKMPDEEGDDVKAKSDGERRRETWMSFSVSSDVGIGESDRSVSNGSSDS